MIEKDVTDPSVRLNKITEDGRTMQYQYNEDGKVSHISDSLLGHPSWTAITYNPLRIDTELFGELKNVTFNNDGYLTHYTIEGPSNNGNNSQTSTTNISFTYNSDGNLTKKEIYTDGPYLTSHICSYIWTGGNLTEVQEVYVDPQENRTETAYNYEYSNEENKYRQYLMRMADIDHYSEHYAPLGWLGKWTKNYPTTCTVKSMDDGEVLCTYTWSEFETNTEGRLTGFTKTDRNRWSDVPLSKKFTYAYENTASTVSTAKKAPTK